MTKKQKDKLKIQQGKLDQALAVLDIQPYQFFHLLQEGPEEVRTVDLIFTNNFVSSFVSYEQINDKFKIFHLNRVILL